MALCAGEVVFIPGWNTEKISAERYYETELAKVYPGERLIVLKWKADVNWSEAVKNAETFSPEVVKYIAGKTAPEQAELTLIGHSLGGRIVIKVAAELAKNKIPVKRIILLGAAVDCDVDLSPVVSASNAPVINIFSENDAVLKHLYPKFQCKCPLGFCGAEKLPDGGLVEYRMKCLDAGKSPEQSLIDGLAWVHSAKNYLEELHLIVDGKRTPYRPKYDCSKADEYLEKNKTFLTLPVHWGIPLKGGVEAYNILAPLLKKLLASYGKDINIPAISDPKVLDSHAGWSLFKVTIQVRFGEKNDPPDEYSVYFIADQYGRIRSWNFFRTPLKMRFNKLKTLIVEKR